MAGMITRKIDPLVREEEATTALAACLDRSERRLVTLRMEQLVQKIIAQRFGMSAGWTCQKLAAIRERCGWEKAKQVKRKPRKKVVTAGRQVVSDNWKPRLIAEDRDVDED